MRLGAVGEDHTLEEVVEIIVRGWWKNHCIYAI